MRKNNKPVRSENLPQDKYFSKKVLFGWSEGTALLKINNVYNDYTNNLFKRRGANLPMHPHFRRKGDASDPLHPFLDTGLGNIVPF